MTESTDSPHWLRGDLHSHCEDHEQVPQYLEGAAERLDFIALTNHAQKPIFFEQHTMLERARELLPDFPIFFGLEWNAPAGVHACVVFPPGEREAEHAYAFARAHDRLVKDSDPSVERALARLAALPESERPILFFNHPASRQWEADSIDRYLRADAGNVVVGIEALHGHQAHARPAAMDPFAYPGAAVGGLADHVYGQSRPFALLAHSDFHVHKQQRLPDYTLGVFNHVRIGVEPGRRDARAIFEALRQGRTCAVQDHWLDLVDFALDGVRPGATWQGGEGRLRLSFEAFEAVERIDLIGRLGPGAPPALLHQFGARDAGPAALEYALPAGAQGFVRARLVAASRRRPAPGPPAPRLFLTSALFLKGRA